MTAAPAALLRRWVHVREEDQPGVRVFRPAGSALPPARGRDGIEFRRDGVVIRYSPGPRDAPVGRAGTWRATGPDTVTITSARGEAEYEILALTDDVLRLRARRTD